MNREAENGIGYLRDMQVDAHLVACVEINPLDLSSECVRVGADYAYWNARYADAMRAYLRAKLDHERTAAAARIQARVLLSNISDAKRVTIEMVEAEIAKDLTVRAAEDYKLETEVDMTRLKGVLIAISTKRDMLIQLGAQVRAEMAADPVLREQVKQRRLVESEG